MKVLLLRSKDAVAFEKEVNDFIAGKKVVDIKYQSFIAPLEYTGAAISKSAVFDSALIMYEEE